MPSIPVVYLETPTATSISRKEGFNRCKCYFTASEDVYKWEARATFNGDEPGRGKGSIVESGGFIKKGDSALIVVDYDELLRGDGRYTISVYVHAVNGYWSDGSYENTYVGLVYNFGSSYNQFRKYNPNITEKPDEPVFGFVYNSGYCYNTGLQYNSTVMKNDNFTLIKE